MGSEEHPVGPRDCVDVDGVEEWRDEPVVRRGDLRERSWCAKSDGCCGREIDGPRSLKVFVAVQSRECRFSCNNVRVCVFAFFDSHTVEVHDWVW